MIGTASISQDKDAERTNERYLGTSPQGIHTRALELEELEQVCTVGTYGSWLESICRAEKHLHFHFPLAHINKAIGRPLAGAGAQMTNRIESNRLNICPLLIRPCCYARGGAQGASFTTPQGVGRPRDFGRAPSGVDDGMDVCIHHLRSSCHPSPEAEVTKSRSCSLPALPAEQNKQIGARDQPTSRDTSTSSGPGLPQID